jgi:prepilin-type processing-associated H-X9-DG protein
LQTGFGALNRFFASVLERTATSSANALSPRQGQPRKIIERGWLKDRAYVLFMDGSVEIETMLGRRLFPSLQDAQEFIA